MFNKLRRSILRPKNEAHYYDVVTVNKILFFIVNQHTEIFSELSSDLLSVITNEIYEHQLKVRSYNSFVFFSDIKPE